MRRPLVLAIVVCGSLTVAASAQRGPHVGMGRPGMTRPEKPKRAGKLEKPAGNEIDRLQRMSPDERRIALANLPPKQQELAERRLSGLDRMTPQEREHLLNRYRRFQQLTPAQQEEVRNVARQFHSLPEQRRAAIKQELDYLKGVPESERGQKLNSPDFRNRFNPSERQIIEQASSVLVEPL